MGFFSKKKAFQGNLPTDLNKLQLSNFRAPPERIIEPEEIREAAGLDTFEPLPIKQKSKSYQQTDNRSPRLSRNEPLYIKVNVYQTILSEMESLKDSLSHLSSIQNILVSSEYNEEHQFAKLRRSVKILHDHLLKSDQILFKS